MPETEDLTDDLRERLAKEAFVSDDFGGHHQANGSPFAYSPYTWESIPEDGRANYRRLVGDLWPVIVEHFAAREAAARREALLEAADWRPTRWWRAATPQGISWAESSDEAEVRERARPGDTIQRLYETVPQTEWRTARAEPERDEESGR